MRYETIESRDVPGEWRVEAINFDADGEVYVAIFSGPSAKLRAKEYAAWKNESASTSAANR